MFNAFDCVQHKSHAAAKPTHTHSDRVKEDAGQLFNIKDNNKHYQQTVNNHKTHSYTHPHTHIHTYTYVQKYEINNAILQRIISI